VLAATIGITLLGCALDVYGLPAELHHCTLYASPEDIDGYFVCRLGSGRILKGLGPSDGEGVDERAQWR
jgi:hypothetical protein